MWIKGEYEGYKYSAKVFQEPSEYGIILTDEENEGKISKLEVRKNGKVICCYDREWLRLPTEKHMDSVSEIIRKYN